MEPESLNYSLLNDKIHGKREGWYESGQKYSEILYINGEKHGKCFCWYRNGSILREINYEHGIINGTIRIN
jgi:uncharacterized protein